MGEHKLIIVIAILVLFLQGCSLVMLRNQESPPSTIESSNKTIKAQPAKQEIKGTEESINISTGAFINQTAPPFSITLTTGEKVTNQPKIDEGLVLYFFTTYCVPCIKEMDEMKRIQPQYRSKSRMIAIDVDPNEDKEKIEKFKKEHLHVIDFALTDKKVLSAFQATHSSIKIGIDHNNIIVSRLESQSDQNEWKDLFKAVTSS